MSQVNYNPSEIEGLIVQSDTIADNIEQINQAVDQAYADIDSRVSRKFASIFGKINRTNDNLRNEISDIDGYNKWLTSTLQDFSATDAGTQRIADSIDTKDIDAGLEKTGTGSGDAALGGLGAIGAGIDGAIGGLGSADGREEFRLDPEKWAALPAATKDAIEAKLKELGFTDEEIKKIKDGETGVDKVVLESLSEQLEQALKTNPSIRQLLIEKYGFDIFNPDGTVNKDLLSIAMLMDGKDPNDQYDLQAFLKELNKANIGDTSGINNQTSGGGTNIPSTNITQIHDNNDAPARNQQNIASTTAHSGAGYSGGDANASTAADSATTSLLDAMTGTEEEGGIEDALSNATTSIAGGKFKPTGNISDIKKGGIGVGAAIAGVGAAAGTAGVGGVLVKKKKDKDKNEENEDDEFNFEDDEFFDQKAEEDSQKDAKPEESNDKEWLYGLGIGLAAAGAAAKITKDKLDKDAEKEENQ